MKRRIACISAQASPLTSASDADSRKQSVYVSELAGQLLKLGYEIDIFTRCEGREQCDVVAYKPGIRIIQVKAGPMEVGLKESLLPYMDEFSFRVSDFISQQNLRYDLVHANFFISGLVALELKKRFHIPFVITFHSLGHSLRAADEQDPFPLSRIAIEEQIVRRADAIVAGSPQDKSDLIQFYKANPRKLFVIPYGFNPGELFPVDKLEARQSLGLDTSEKVILHAGPVDRKSGAANVIRSMALLNAEKGLRRLVVVPLGRREANSESAAELDRLKNLADDLGVSRQVTFVNRQEQDQLNCYYSAADLFVSTPCQGSFGGSPLEAMACGTPVIATDDGDLKSSVLEGKTGFLIPEGNPDALADRIGLMLSNEALLHQMSRSAVRHVNSCFTWAIIANHVHNLYEYILLNHLQRNDPAKPMQIKALTNTIPLRNMYLRRHIESTYGS
jgi:D-inositol-3-phosphate glycosyltransferase